MFPNLIGNSKIKNGIGKRIIRGAAGHAVILEGPCGSGRHTAAMEIAAAFACTSGYANADADFPCGSCSACRKLYEGYSPDVFYTNRGDKATIGVDVIRDMVSSLCFAPLESSRKVYIIEDAEKMTRQAQNTLLMSLEEPPEYVFFILITASALSLLETVRSRAPVFRMERFQSSDVREYLMKTAAGAKINKADSAALYRIAAASNGVLGRAVELCGTKDQKALNERRSTAKEAVKALCSGSAEQCIAAALSLSADKSETVEILNDMKIILRDCACAYSGSNVSPRFFTDLDEVREFSSGMSLRKTVFAYNSVCEASNALNRNANIGSTVSAMMLSRVYKRK